MDVLYLIILLLLHFLIILNIVFGRIALISLDEILHIIKEKTNLKLVDVKPTYWHWRDMKPPKLMSILRHFITLPLMPKLLNYVDRFYTNNLLPLGKSDAFYIVLKK